MMTKPVRNGSQTVRRAVFLDRDGVLNAPVARSCGEGPPWSLDELRLLPGVRAACERLRQAGWKLIVVTNQPDAARGCVDRDTIVAINRRLQEWLPLNDVRACLHDDADGCLCRKPKPGMLLDAADDMGLELAQCWMVGDRIKDIGAGQAAGCRTLLIGRDGQAANLADAAEIILKAG